MLEFLQTTQKRRNFLTALLYLLLVPLSPTGETISSDWRMFGGTAQRSLQAKGEVPAHWSIETGHNVRWIAELGTQTYSSPIISRGKVFVGTNNDNPRNLYHQGDMGVLMAFDEATGDFLWQAATSKLETGTAQDWPGVGVCSSPLVIGDRMYFVNNRNQLVALDTEGFWDGENDGPITGEHYQNITDADYVWILDLIEEFGVYPHNASNSSPVPWEELIFVGTSNGRSEDHTIVPSPEAPSLVAIDRDNGKLRWSDNSPRDNILNGQWASPTVASIGGVDQVIMPNGDGWIRAFQAKTGEKLWEFDTNPSDSVYPETRNEILGTPGVSGELIYIANGQDPENGEGEGSLFAINGQGRGDITEKGLVWQYSGIRRSISSPVIHEGLIYYPDFSGFLHCLDAKTGDLLWVHDTFAAIWGSPVVVGDRIYLGDEDGDVVVLRTGNREEVLGENNLGAPIYTTPSPANNTLYVATMGKLFAIHGKTE